MRILKKVNYIMKNKYNKNFLNFQIFNRILIFRIKHFQIINIKVNKKMTKSANHYKLIKINMNKTKTSMNNNMNKAAMIKKLTRVFKTRNFQFKIMIQNKNNVLRIKDLI
jgi:hypothetical protein